MSSWLFHGRDLSILSNKIISIILAFKKEYFEESFNNKNKTQSLIKSEH
jgi:hypothetical protein